VNSTTFNAGGPNLTSAAGLAPGQSVTLPIQLRNSGTAVPSYTPKVYSGAF
jgi:uncharacterized protein